MRKFTTAAVLATLMAGSGIAQADTAALNALL